MKRKSYTKHVELMTRKQLKRIVFSSEPPKFVPFSDFFNWRGQARHELVRRYC